MTIRDREKIFADILTHPELDEPRLEFARCIASADPVWARYIERSLATHEFGYHHPSLSDELDQRVLEPLRQFGDVTASFYRGFPEALYAPVDVFIRHGDALLDLAPIIEVRVLSNDDRDEPFPLGELLQCSAIRRVLALYIDAARFDHAAYKTVITAPSLERLLKLETPDVFTQWLPRPETAEAESEMWAAIFASPNARRMIDWGLPMTHKTYGDRLRIESPESDYWETLTYEPMPLADREIEQRYGYIPRLHAGNWGASVLDVLRGKKPDFPVGATPVEAMYVVPAPVRRRTTLVEY